MLWDDDDSECQKASHFAQANNIPMFDLTNGLLRITLKDAPIVAPEIVEVPEAEEVPVSEPVVLNIIVDEDEDEEDDDESLDTEDYSEFEFGELITVAIEEAGRIFAKSFAEEFIRLLKK